LEETRKFISFKSIQEINHSQNYHQQQQIIGHLKVIRAYFQGHPHCQQQETAEILSTETEQDTPQHQRHIGNGVGLGIMSDPEDYDEISGKPKGKCPQESKLVIDPQDQQQHVNSDKVEEKIISRPG